MRKAWQLVMFLSFLFDEGKELHYKRKHQDIVN